MNLIYLLTACIIIFSSMPAQAESSDEFNNDDLHIKNEIIFLNKLIKSNANDIEILRRDQINYQIEKDLLEKSYSINYERLNLSITFILTLLGVFGIYSAIGIKNLKDNYSNELNELKQLKTQYDEEFKKILVQQEEVQKQVNKLSEDQSLRMMEIIEKVVTHINMKNWQWALQWISHGLHIEANNLMLLQSKTHCLVELGDLKGATDACKILVELAAGHPKHNNAILNLLEILALNSNPEFDVYYQKYKEQISKEYNDNLIADYLIILKSIVDNDLNKTKELLNPYISLKSGQAIVFGFTQLWSFEPSLRIIPVLSTPLQKEYLQTVINFYSGSIDGSALKNFLSMKEMNNDNMQS